MLLVEQATARNSLMPFYYQVLLLDSRVVVSVLEALRTKEKDHMGYGISWTQGTGSSGPQSPAPLLVDLPLESSTYASANNASGLMFCGHTSTCTSVVL